ncbi:hypothetical protein [Nitrospirillum iridis]|uniref:Uncharacterized protein n=1 Tax=Nitrospirillum iridis TaxID=765888 RepID=A0A7X0EF78_9PROT|nr:hypothetical protein [Nitrospirillum iridis]MBB6253740.1 hypothetical protein [Nitrospirillum iridis]
MAAPTPLAVPYDAHHRRLSPDTRIILMVLAALSGALSLFAGVVLRDLFPFIGVMLQGF